MQTDSPVLVLQDGDDGYSSPQKLLLNGDVVGWGVGKRERRVVWSQVTRCHSDLFKSANTDHSGLFKSANADHGSVRIGKCGCCGYISNRILEWHASYTLLVLGAEGKSGAAK